MKSADGSKNVPVGALIAVLAEEGDDLSTADEFAKKASQETAEPKKEEEKAPAPPKPTEQPKSEKKESASKKEDLPAGDRIFASPIAKKIALERGIPLSKVKGSGPSGRILREDVEKFKAAPESATAAASAPSVPASDYVDLPISNMRRTIGARLTQSKQELPHYYLTVSIDMSKVNKLREVFNKQLAEKDKGAKLSVNDFILKAVSNACADVPEANSAWLGETIRQYVA